MGVEEGAEPGTLCAGPMGGQRGVILRKRAVHRH